MATPQQPSLNSGDRCDLRIWFTFFLLWMGGLTLLAKWADAAVTSPEVGFLPTDVPRAVWLLSVYAFYLSLCCTFFPAPTSWIVMLVASDTAAQQLGMPGPPWLRVVITATVGALGTGLANLNEYHVFTYLLRFRRVQTLRQTRLYESATRWLGVAPFATLVIASLVPIPVDFVRWWAIAHRYPRLKFFMGYFLGRWVRYAVWAIISIELSFSLFHIIAVQGGLIVLVLLGKLASVLASRSRAAKSVEQKPIPEPAVLPPGTVEIG